ncbi:GNAT family N-acetyltransferase [Clostridium saccharobutylicum]|uniref:N-acetyltransferase domain-containing protein n=1 Tax=Clostridium saccharobutylicum TaxID=169679 RepID=A0A1S8MP27_CLOSA|nr:GNAT family N-acetyltransferase [Clostridium saccharobutylicum]OOM05949.1 hypothetical protein CLOSAC_45280 [Clostridium saccharobutylicum]
MNLKKLDNEEIVSVYNNHMKMDFPAQELKPLDVIQKLIKRKIYICYGLYDNDKLLAYAFLVTSNLYLLLDYYAVCDQCRCKGIGSKFLNMLKEKCKDYEGIIIEVEKIEYAVNESQEAERKRRIDFYKRNGALMTKISSELFNVNFSIMCLLICSIRKDDFIISESLKTIYKQMVPSSLYSKYVKITYDEE